MSHPRAVALMVLATLLWSIAGVVTRHLDAARSFEVTFWRSLFNALALLLLLLPLRGAALFRDILAGNRVIWFSGLCWAVMYTAFMVALTLTSVANVLVAMATGPLLTALSARIFLGHRLPARTWIAIGVAGLGIAWMFGVE
ncbi:MAG: EamA family transporter, partial [Sulfuritalea sp.]|nr:EamA family transporter [Sulfuritalea sp.]